MADDKKVEVKAVPAVAETILVPSVKEGKRSKFAVSINGETSLVDAELSKFEAMLKDEVAAFVARYAVKPSVHIVGGGIEVESADNVSFEPAKEE